MRRFLLPLALVGSAAAAEPFLPGEAYARQFAGMSSLDLRVESVTWTRGIPAGIDPTQRETIHFQVLNQHLKAELLTKTPDGEEQVVMRWSRCAVPDVMAVGTAGPATSSVVEERSMSNGSPVMRVTRAPKDPPFPVALPPFDSIPFMPQAKVLDVGWLRHPESWAAQPKARLVSLPSRPDRLPFTAPQIHDQITSGLGTYSQTIEISWVATYDAAVPGSDLIVPVRLVSTMGKPYEWTSVTDYRYGRLDPAGPVICLGIQRKTTDADQALVQHGESTVTAFTLNPPLLEQQMPLPSDEAQQVWDEDHGIELKHPPGDFPGTYR